ncbi:unnamed protein product, partial [Iphiclides podalirius]
MRCVSHEDRVKRMNPFVFGLVRPLTNVRTRQPVLFRQPNGMGYYPVNPNYNYVIRNPAQNGVYTNRQGLPADRISFDTTSNNTIQPNLLSVTEPCEVSVSETSIHGFICKGQLLFEDNFNSNLDDDKIWTSEIFMPDQPDYPFNIYEKKALVEDGKLVIRPITLESEYGIDFVRRSLDLRDRCTATTSISECYREAFGPQILPPAITAKITTKRTFSFKYGRIEVGAKMPVGDWLIPVIQLEPHDNAYGALNYASGLIRIACVKGNIEYSKKLYGGAILSESDPFRSANLFEKIGNDQWSKNFHNYTVVWSPDGVSVFVDGEKYGEVLPNEGFFEEANRYYMSAPTNWLKGSLMAPLDEMFYVSLGLDVGGIHEFPDSPSKPWSNASNKAMLEFWNSRNKCGYEVPPAKLEAIYPKGLRVSVPDDGYSLFAFHGKLNEEMEGLEAGQWSRDITKAKNGWWIFRDRDAVLKIGDKIYFWTYVIKDGLGYRQDNGEWTVTGFVDEEGIPVNINGTPLEPTTETPTSTEPSTSVLVTKPSLEGYPCQLSESKVSVPGFVCQGQLLFEDTFNGPIEKGQIWKPEIKFPGEPDYPFNVYMSDKNICVKDGHLLISPMTLESIYGEDFVRQSLDLSARCTGVLGTSECSREASGPLILPPIITAKVTTKNRFSFKYGRIEVRARMPLGNWLIPEIHLEPRDKAYGFTNYASGLMRIACVKGNLELANKLYGGPIMSESEPYRTAYLKEKTSNDLWTTEFHNYTLIWTPKSISLLVDGDQYGEVTPGSGFYEEAKRNDVTAASQWLRGSEMAPFDELFYISLGLSVGGIHEFPDSCPKSRLRASVRSVNGVNYTCPSVLQDEERFKSKCWN